MGFSGVRAIVMVVILIALVLAVTKLGLPGWILPVGLIGSGALVKSVTIHPAGPNLPKVQSVDDSGPVSLIRASLPGRFAVRHPVISL